MQKKKFFQICFELRGSMVLKHLLQVQYFLIILRLCVMFWRFWPSARWKVYIKTFSLCIFYRRLKFTLVQVNQSVLVQLLCCFSLKSLSCNIKNRSIIHHLDRVYTKKTPTWQPSVAELSNINNIRMKSWDEFIPLIKSVSSESSQSNNKQPHSSLSS